MSDLTGFSFQYNDGLFKAIGDGWCFKGIPGKSKFTQEKKIPSIRMVKSLVKELVKASAIDGCKK